jgi:hypothetical protein
MDNSSELLIFYAISSKMEMKELLKFLQDFLVLGFKFVDSFWQFTIIIILLIALLLDFSLRPRCRASFYNNNNIFMVIVSPVGTVGCKKIGKRKFS